MLEAIDHKDWVIIERLRSNARTPFTKIAEELGVTEATIRKRVKALEDRKVISRYTINVDPAKLGYSVVALIGIDTEPDRYLDVIKELQALHEVRSLSASSGDHMIMIEFWAHNHSELMQFTDRITAMKGVTKVCPAVLLEKLK